MAKKNFFCFCILLGLNAQAQVINFADPNLKARLLMSTVNNGIAVDFNGNFMVVDANGDNEIEVAEAMAVYQIELSNASITSLAGIENFVNLTWLNCNNNNVTLQPLSDLVNLTGISCIDCGLTSLAGVENLPLLQSISFSNNPLTNVNLQNLSELWRIWCENTLVTEINLCGTNVRFLWCTNNPYLTTLYLKNDVVSNDLAKNGSQIPPPLHNFEFYNTPLLNYICYDEGEYAAVFHGIGQDTTGKTLTTSCNNTCSLSNQGNLIVAFTIYPNPTENQLQIGLPDTVFVKRISISNALGQKLLSKDNATVIDVSTLAQGNYFITIDTNNGKATQQFIKN